MEKIELPAPPQIQRHETAEDKRKFAVVPLAALRDRRLTPATKAVLAMVCSYCNKAGITHVSQNRVAQDMHTSQAAISKAMGILKNYGYIEVIGKHYPMSRGRTLRIVFDPEVTLEDAVGIASREGEDLRPASMRIDSDETVRQLMEKETWTEEELKANKERLARLLIDAFKTPYDKPKLYTAAQGDTMAVKKAKEAIRARMRELRKEQYQASKQKQSDLSSEYTNTEKISLYIQNESSIDSQGDISELNIESAKQMGYEELVVYFENELFNGVKTESDLHVCSLLAERGITKTELQRYITAYSGETVTQIGKRILA